MKTSDYTIKVIEVENPNGYLTQNKEGLEIIDVILSKKVFLAVNDKPSNWKEITPEEGEDIILKKKEYEERNLTNN